METGKNLENRIDSTNGMLCKEEEEGEIILFFHSGISLFLRIKTRLSTVCPNTRNQQAYSSLLEALNRIFLRERENKFDSVKPGPITKSNE